MTEPVVIMQARTPQIAELVDLCARGQIGFDVLCHRVADMGYRTTSLFEMVVAAEREIEEAKKL